MNNCKRIVLCFGKLRPFFGIPVLVLALIFLTESAQAQKTQSLSEILQKLFL